MRSLARLVARSLAGAAGLLIGGVALADDAVPGVTVVNGVPILDPDVVLAQPMEPRTFTWMHNQAGNVSQMPLAATHLCVLTKVTGKFLGGGERVALVVDNKGFWRLRGQSGQSELAVEATCVKKIKFVPAAAHPERLTAVRYGSNSTGGCGAQLFDTPDTVTKRAFFLSEVSGKFRGGGEQLTVVEHGGKGALRVAACSGFVAGTAMSLGDTHMPGAIFRSAAGTLGTLDKGDMTFAISQGGPPSRSWYCSLGLCGIDTRGSLVEPNTMLIAPVDEALCGIVAITGKMQGYGEFVKIGRTQNGGRQWWTLQVQELGEDASLTGAARCFSRNQFKPPQS